MRPSLRLIVAALLLIAVLASPQVVRAEIIDFDPTCDEVPSILSPDELARYRALADIQTVGLASTASPSGRYVLVRVASEYRVLDVVTRIMEPIDLGQRIGVTSWWWLDDGRAVSVAMNMNHGGLEKLVLNATVPAITASPLNLPAAPPGKRLVPFGGPLLALADGSLHLVVYTQTVAQPMSVFERPTLSDTAASPLDSLDWTPPQREQVWLLQAEEQILAINIDTGASLSIASLPRGADLYLSLSTLRSRPGTSQVAYLAAMALPWAGQTVGGRPYRGGGMPLGYWNTREALGQIPVASNRWITTRSLEILDLGSGQHRSIANGDFGSATQPPPRFSSLFWTADGRRLVVKAATPSILAGREHPVYEYPSGTRFLVFDPSGNPLGELQWAVPYFDGPYTALGPVVGSQLALTVADNLWRDVYFVDGGAPNAPVRPIYLGPRMLSAAVIAGDKLVYVMQDVADPPELYVSLLDNLAGTQVRLTEVNATARQASRIRYQLIQGATSAGYEVTGLYVYPAEEGFPPSAPRPLVVWQEGGPGGQMMNVWQTSVESPCSLLPNFGLPVLMVNAAGRVANGARVYSALADGDNFGQRDIADVKEIVEQLIGRGIVERRAVGVTGCSYGGYFTLQSLATYPELYAAGNSQCSFNDLLYEWNFGWSPLVGYLMGQAATANPAEFLRDSPAYQARRIRSPLLLFHGTEDFLPYELVTNIHDQVAANAVAVRYWRAKGYGHGIGEAPGDPDGAVGQSYAAQLQIDWFRRYLQPSGSTLAARLTLSAWPSWSWFPFVREEQP